MNNMWKRSLSLLLALVMVAGMLPTIVLASESSTDTSTVDTNTGDAENTENSKDHSLDNADGFIWLVKGENAENGGASDALIEKIGSGLLDDMIRDAVGDTTGALVEYNGIDLNDTVKMGINWKKLENMKSEVIASMENHELVTFMIGGEPKKLAFRNILNATVQVKDIYINGQGEPADLAAQLENALDTLGTDENVVISQNGDISLEMADAEVSDLVTYPAVWPEAGQRAFAAKFTVTIRAVDDEEVTKSDTGWVILQDTRKLFTVTYCDGLDGALFADIVCPGIIEGEQTPAIADPQRTYYTFTGWDIAVADTVTADVVYTAQWAPELDNAGQQGVADQEESFTITFKDGVGGAVFADDVHTLAWGSPIPSFVPTRQYYTFLGWDAVVAQSVIDDATYTATWAPEVDRDGNGIADQEQTFNITYYVDGQVYSTLQANGEAATPTPATPTKDGFYFAGWKDAQGGGVSLKVTSDATYYAQWAEVYYPNVTYVITFEDQSQTQININVGLDYKAAILPAIGDTEITIWSGWLDANGNPYDFDTVLSEDITLYCTFWPDINNNGLVDGTMADPLLIFKVMHQNGFVMETHQYYEGQTEDFDINDITYPATPTDGQLFVRWDERMEIDAETFTITVTYTPVIVADRNNNDIEDGADGDRFTYYIFEKQDGTELGRVDWLDGDPDVDPDDYRPTLAENEVFVRWDHDVAVDAQTYTITITYTAVVILDENGNKMDDTLEKDYLTIQLDDLDPSEYTVEYFADYALVTYNGYVGRVEITDLKQSDGKFFYEDGQTVITVTPLWNADESEMAAYVANVTLDGIALNLHYDNYTASNEGLTTVVRTRGVDGHELKISYALAQLELKKTPDILEQSEEHTEETVYNAVVSSPAYNDEKVTVLYLAREARELVLGLDYLFSQLDSNIASAVRQLLGGDTVTIQIEKKWCAVEETTEWKTAKSVLNSYVDQILEESTVDGEIDMYLLIPKITSLKKVLKQEINDKAEIRNFGYNPDGKDLITETLDITYEDEKVQANKGNVSVQLKENRVATQITLDEETLTYTYGQYTDQDLLANATLTDATGNEIPGLALDTKYEGLSVGTYTVTVSYAGNKDYMACSKTFTLTITKAATSIVIKDFRLEEEWLNYDPSPIVTPGNAGVVHVIAGVDVNTLKMDLVEGVIKNQGAGDIRVNAWIKLPAGYNDILSAAEIGDDFYTVAQIREKLAGTELEGPMGETLNSVDSLLNTAQSMVAKNLNLDMEFTLMITFKQDAYPEDAGFYLNYARIMDTTNYEPAEDYGTIVITPLLAIPNQGGVELVYENAENLFIFEYDGESKPLRVTYQGEPLDNEIYYYGINNRANLTKEVPTLPGVYVATTVYTDREPGQTELKKVGSDSAVIVITPKRATIEVGRDTVVYDGEAHLPTISLTDKNGDPISGAMTIISGTAGVNTDGNIALEDLTVDVNIDFPERLEGWLETFRQETGVNVLQDRTPASVISFLNWYKDKINNSIPEEKLVSLKVPQTYIDKLQTMSTEVCDKLIAQIERLPDDITLSFKDIEDLEYKQTGAYLFVGVITDPDLTPDVNAGLLVIRTADKYEMYDTYVPYNGLEQDIEIDDETTRDGLIFVVDRATNEVTFLLDSDMTAVVTAALDKAGYTLYSGSDVYVGTVYNKGEAVAEALTDAIIAQIRVKALDKLEAKFPRLGNEFDAAVRYMDTKLTSLTRRLSEYLQSIDRMPSDTLLIINGSKPVAVGEYEFYGFDYDVAYTNAKLYIEPIHIVVEDNPASKYVGYGDPELTVDVKFFANSGVAPMAPEMIEVELPAGYNLDQILKTIVSRTGGETKGFYDISVSAELLNDYDGLFILDEIVQDDQDFEIKGVSVTVEVQVTDEVVVDSATDGVSITVTAKDEFDRDVADAGYTIKNAVGETVTLDEALSVVGTYTVEPNELPNVTNFTSVDYLSDTFEVVKRKVDLVAESGTEIFAGSTTEIAVKVYNAGTNTQITVAPEDVTYVITNRQGNEVDKATALATPGVYTITPNLLNTTKYEAVGLTTTTLTVKVTAGTIDNNSVQMSLRLVDTVHINFRFEVDGFDGWDREQMVDEIGLLVFHTKHESSSEATHATADDIITGGEYDAENGWFVVRSNGIPAKNMGDDAYYKMFVKLADGSYVYSGRFTYSPLRYAKEKLAIADGTEDQKRLKSLCMALMNYGSAAQVYFQEIDEEYEYTSLMNSTLTAYQDTVEDFDSATMVDSRAPSVATSLNVDQSKFNTNAYNFSLVGAIELNFKFTTKVSFDEAGIVVWEKDQYTGATELTLENASYIHAANSIDGMTFTAKAEGMAPKEMGETIMVSGYIVVDGEYYYTPVLRRSLDYCADGINNGNYGQNFKNTMKAMVVYGEYAKLYFAGLEE